MLYDIMKIIQDERRKYMENQNNEQQKKINEELYSFFSNFITEGKVYKEKEVAPGFFVKLRALTTEEIIEAESVILNATDNLIVADIGARIRSCSILSFAIETIGNKEIYTQEELTEATEEAKNSATYKRAAMYNNLLKLPPQLLSKIYELYLEAVREQNTLYQNPEKIEEQSENFSNPPSDI